MLVTMIGYLAAFFTTISFVPQVIKTLRTQNTKDISLGMYICFIIGLILWASYGIMLMEWPIIIANTITICLAGIVLLLKIQNG